MKNLLQDWVKYEKFNNKSYANLKKKSLAKQKYMESMTIKLVILLLFFNGLLTVCLGLLPTHQIWSYMLFLCAKVQSLLQALRNKIYKSEEINKNSLIPHNLKTC